MKIDVADLIARLDTLEKALQFADQVNGRLVREAAVMEQRLTACEGTIVGLKNEVQRADIIAQKSMFKVDTMKDMYERKYDLDVEAGVAEAIANAARVRANSAAQKQVKP